MCSSSFFFGGGGGGGGCGGNSGGLCFVIVAFPGCLHLHFYVIDDFTYGVCFAIVYSSSPRHIRFG